MRDSVGIDDRDPCPGGAQMVRGPRTEDTCSYDDDIGAAHHLS
jgi:hypothetical protein